MGGPGALPSIRVRGAAFPQACYSVILFRLTRNVLYHFKNEIRKIKIIVSKTSRPDWRSFRPDLEELFAGSEFGTG